MTDDRMGVFVTNLVAEEQVLELDLATDDAILLDSKVLWNSKSEKDLTYKEKLLNFNGRRTDIPSDNMEDDIEQDAEEEKEIQIKEDESKLLCPTLCISLEECNEICKG
ncbi:uncharacterized protein G2W53_021712 [Senna tora]|uniref:Uncharacterized protein n=1 Tax=Senna tora TaxID=362788 RepID=A0A834TK23_9FABA|nr:uncharacterized protein G2W53_021712 [Senna tora]